MAKLIQYEKELYLKKAFNLIDARVYLCILPGLTGYHCLTRAEETLALLVEASGHCLSSTSLEKLIAETSERGWPVIHPAAKLPDDDDQRSRLTGTPCITCHNAPRGFLKFSSLVCSHAITLRFLSGAAGSEKAMWRGTGIFTASVLGLIW